MSIITEVMDNMSVVTKVMETIKTPSKIVLQGRMGCGKTTVLNEIGRQLLEREKPFFYVSEGSGLTEQIKHLVLSNANVTLLIDGAHRFESHFIEDLLKHSGSVVLASQQFSYSSSGWTLCNLEKQS